MISVTIYKMLHASFTSWRKLESASLTAFVKSIRFRKDDVHSLLGEMFAQEVHIVYYTMQHVYNV